MMCGITAYRALHLEQGSRAFFLILREQGDVHLRKLPKFEFAENNTLTCVLIFSVRTTYAGQQ